MIFKQDWEKTQSPTILSYNTIEAMLKQAHPQKKLLSYEMISGGCANLNIKINFEHEDNPSLLRIYLRDPAAQRREQKIGQLLYPTIPVPRTYYGGIYQNYNFAITEFMPGITLRDLLLSQHLYSLDDIMFKVGTMLAKVANNIFPTAGFFDHNLEIIQQTKPEDLLLFSQQYLHHQILKTHLTPQTRQKLSLFFEQYQPVLLNLTDHHLVHADFDPANILVNQIKGVWQVSAILDWEFSFAGSMMWDIANMLRYAHLMPPIFATSFIKGTESCGIVLPPDWQVMVYLLNLISLMELLTRTDSEKYPRKRADICSLIDYFLAKLQLDN